MQRPTLSNAKDFVFFLLSPQKSDEKKLKKGGKTITSQYPERALPLLRHGQFAMTCAVRDIPSLGTVVRPL